MFHVCCYMGREPYDHYFFFFFCLDHRDHRPPPVTVHTIRGGKNLGEGLGSGVMRLIRVSPFVSCFGVSSVIENA